MALGAAQQFGAQALVDRGGLGRAELQAAGLQVQVALVVLVGAIDALDQGRQALQQRALAGAEPVALLQLRQLGQAHQRVAAVQAERALELSSEQLVHGPAAPQASPM